MPKSDNPVAAKLERTSGYAIIPGILLPIVAVLLVFSPATFALGYLVLAVGFVCLMLGILGTIAARIIQGVDWSLRNR